MPETLEEFMPVIVACPAPSRVVILSRERGYHALVRGEKGMWVIGRDFESRRAAQKAVKDFLRDEPREPSRGTPRWKLPRNWLWDRDREHRRPRFRYTRCVKGDAWQARVWVGSALGSVNLGLFTVLEHPSAQQRPRDEMAEIAAGRASKEFVRFYNPKQRGHGLRETLEHLQSQGIIREVLPPRVERVPGGYRGRVKIKGDWVTTRKYADCWDCYEAIGARVAAKRRELKKSKSAPPPLSETERAERKGKRLRRRKPRIPLFTLGDFLEIPKERGTRSSAVSTPRRRAWVGC